MKDKNVFIDGYNVLITVESICSSGDKFLLNCDDGVTEISSCFREIQKDETTQEALNSIISLLKMFNPKNVLFSMTVQ